jgi:signal transduction histidine kinase
LVNAVKHNPPGVKVTVQGRADANWLCLTVADNGKGIEPEQQERLFELKTGEGRHRQLTGIGVGLCLCQQIVSAHGGKISLQSRLGQGSAFQVSLPRGGGLGRSRPDSISPPDLIRPSAPVDHQ